MYQALMKRYEIVPEDLKYLLNGSNKTVNDQMKSIYVKKSGLFIIGATIYIWELGMYESWLPRKVQGEVVLLREALRKIIAKVFPVNSFG